MKIKEMRKRRGFTQVDLAKRLGTTQQTVARWESGKTEVSVSQLKALAVVLECTVSDVLGKEMPAKEWKGSPFAVIKPDMPFGTLRLCVGGRRVEYPIDEEAVSNLDMQLAKLAVDCDDNNTQSWLITRTLDNKILFVNPSYVSDVEMISDDAEEMPNFFHPEVYQSLRNWGAEDIEPSVAERCRALIGDMDVTEVQLSAVQILVRMGDGTEGRYPLDDDVAMALWTLELNSFNVPNNSFLMVYEEGRDVTKYVNLAHVALLELPAEEYLRLNAPEGE